MGEAWQVNKNDDIMEQALFKAKREGKKAAYWLSIRLNILLLRKEANQN